MRLALRSAAANGYYVFDELMTDEAGMIDFLAVGPVGGCVVVVRDEPGTVTADVDATLYLNTQPFDEDPKRQGAELADDVNRKFERASVNCFYVVCFTRAELAYLGDDDEVLHGVCPTWDLPLTFSEAAKDLAPSDVDNLADLVREAFGRPPFVVPEEGEL